MNFEQLKLAEDEEALNNMTSIWLISLADLISLILTFFIMIYSTRDVSQAKLIEISDSFIEYVNTEPVKKFNFIFNPSTQVKFIKKSTDIVYIETILKNSLRDRESLGINIRSEPNQVIIEFSDDDDNIKDLSDDTMKDRLYVLSKTLNTLSNQIEVIATGTDKNDTLRTAEFVGDRIEEFGYEYKIMRTINNKNIITENVEKNKNNTKIEILVKNYEFAF